jgi:hypothetical protein
MSSKTATRNRKGETRSIIAVDVDGVLAEQASPVLETARKKLGVVMCREQVVERNDLANGGKTLHDQADWNISPS